MTMQPWFAEAKLGVFLHWGIYAVDGVAESWSFFDGSVPYDRYMKQLDGFTAGAYDPAAWARLFKKAGARYAVLTAKHHDGVALWDTRQSDLSVVRRTPAARDLIGPYTEALRAEGLKVGLYFSHLDWSHPDYASVPHEGPDLPPVMATPNPFSVPPNDHHPTPDPTAWERFLAFHRAQLHELVDGYAPDLLWFDGHWERNERQWQMQELRADLLARSPQMILNARMHGHGDYATPEQGVPITPPEGPWELCYTINNSWGHQHRDNDHKPLALLIRTFAETIAAGGNLLLDVGPREDGTIPPEQATRLEALGGWIEQNADAIHPTVPGIPSGHHHGPTTMAKDRRTLYVFCEHTPTDFITIRGLRTGLRRASVLSTGEVLPHRTYGGFADVPGVLTIAAPARPDRHMTVIALELDGELELYRGGGHG